MATGMRVAPRWKAERKGHITDIERVRARRAAEGRDRWRRRRAGDDDGVQRGDHVPHPGHAELERAERATEEGRFLGLRCPICGRTYTGGKGYCPIDTIELESRARGRSAPDRAWSRTTRSSRPSSIRGRPRPSRSRGFTCSSTASDVVHGLPGAHRSPERRGPHRHAGERRVGVGRAKRAASGWNDVNLDRLDPDRRTRCRRPDPREQDLTDGARTQPKTTSRSSAGTSRRWCAIPTRPRRRCSSRS